MYSLPATQGLSLAKKSSVIRQGWGEKRHIHEESHKRDILPGILTAFSAATGPARSDLVSCTKMWLVECSALPLQAGKWPLLFISI